MPDDAKHDQEFVGSQFTLEIGGVELGRFQAVSGLNWETEVDRVQGHHQGRQGRHPQAARPDQVPRRHVQAGHVGRRRAAQVVPDGAWTARSSARNGSIVVYDLAGAEVDRWNFEAAGRRSGARPTSTPAATR